VRANPSFLIEDRAMFRDTYLVIKGMAILCELGSISGITIVREEGVGSEGQRFIVARSLLDYY
jgi:hypothetical protein